MSKQTLAQRVVQLEESVDRLTHQVDRIGLAYRVIGERLDDTEKAIKLLRNWQQTRR